MAARPPIDLDDPALGLTMAVIRSSPTPLLWLDGELRIAGASESFCDAFGIDLSTAVHGTLSELGSGGWGVPQLRVVLDAIASGTPQDDAFEMELERADMATHCLVITARQLAYHDLGQPWLLVAVADITEARANELAKDRAVEQLSVLLREVRHRVANSLQIVSSVLLQTARRTSSDETRDGLTDAHHRIMSVASLERQLSASPDGDQSVELLAYFTSLCDSMAASMIEDPDRISLVVSGSGVVSSRMSVSLGLIVTELVINALKYAFPSGRTGRIEIGYEAHGPNWTLSVRDDGVGMPDDPTLIRTGLGTDIVRALARQLQATVDVAPANPGTVVFIEHIQVAIVGGSTNASAALQSGSRTTRREPAALGRSTANG